MGKVLILNNTLIVKEKCHLMTALDQTWQTLLGLEDVSPSYSENCTFLSNRRHNHKLIMHHLLRSLTRSVHLLVDDQVASGKPGPDWHPDRSSSGGVQLLQWLQFIFAQTLVTRSNWYPTPFSKLLNGLMARRRFTRTRMLTTSLCGSSNNMKRRPGISCRTPLKYPCSLKHYTFLSNITVNCVIKFNTKFHKKSLLLPLHSEIQ